MNTGANPLGLALEPEAQAFTEASEVIPYLYTVPPEAKRKMLDELQARPTPRPEADDQWYLVDDRPDVHPAVPVRIVRPRNITGTVPVLLFVHGAGWVMGNAATHDRLVRELAHGARVAVAFPEYALSPEARYPTALEQCWTVATWLTKEGAGLGLDPTRMGVAGDQMGGTIAAALTLLATRRGGVEFLHQTLLYPATAAGFDTESYRLFATGYGLRAEGYRDFWNQYCPDETARLEPTAAPLQASLDELATLPPALVITAEADCLRDEGEAYASALRRAGVPALATRYSGVTNAFMMLDVMRGTVAADTAITQAAHAIGANLHS